MKSVSISGSLRENVGKKDAKALRKQGLVPSVLYGGKEQMTLTVEEKALLKLINTSEVFTIKLNVNNKEYNCVIKEKQFHPVTDKILHIDFQEVSEKKPVAMEIPIKVFGTSPGVLAGGKLQTKLRKLKVKGIYTEFPDFIDVDISKLQIGNSVKVGQLIQENIEFLDKPNNVVVMVKLTRGAMSAAQEEEEAAAEAAKEAGAEGSTEAETKE